MYQNIRNWVQHKKHTTDRRTSVLEHRKEVGHGCHCAMHTLCTQQPAPIEIYCYCKVSTKTLSIHHKTHTRAHRIAAAAAAAVQTDDKDINDMIPGIKMG
jgi:hypothetical protein